MQRVVLIQRILPHYRMSFFERLAADLARDDIDLCVVFGQERPAEVPQSVSATPSWATRIDNRYFDIGPLQVVWQPCLDALHGSDLLVFEQSNALLLNYFFLSRLIGRDAQLAFWGHGRNRQAAGWRLTSERLKRLAAGRVDWWFAYTASSREHLLALGFPADRITVVNNSVDTEGLAVNPGDTAMNAGRGNTCIYCGGMYPAKRLDFLLDAAPRIRQLVPDFELLLIGSGPTSRLAEDAAAKHSWIRYLGPLTGTARGPWFRMSRAQLMPGLVGLAIIDAFAAGTPLITTDLEGHGPEIDYLVHEVNGLISQNSVEAYAQTVADYLRSREMQARLSDGCRLAAANYTIDNMVARFSSGIRRCLDARGR